ncbi:lactadherin-like [Argopecten irradians]|uniref:lactadherin-like n=1 Tax=Argopecten irradians TaxID=31199 RepID=UPI0037167927
MPSSSCNFSLVTGPHGVSDDALSASSTHSHCQLAKMRINSDDAWCPLSTNNGEYVQVELKTKSQIKEIQTRGRGVSNQWVSSYSVSCSMDGITYTPILDNDGDIKVFPGNTDSNTLVSNTIEGEIIAKFIRVTSLSGNMRNSMRLEVKGCSACFSSLCSKWIAKRGSASDVLQIIEDTDASNQGTCGIKCYRWSGCEGFLFEPGFTRCRLLNSNSSVSTETVNLDGVWYFVKNLNSTTF